MVIFFKAQFSYKDFNHEINKTQSDKYATYKNVSESHYKSLRKRQEKLGPITVCLFVPVERLLQPFIKIQIIEFES